MKQVMVVNENGGLDTYSYREQTDSQGNHIYYSGSRGNYYTTHLGFYSVIYDLIKRGKNFTANFDCSRLIKEAEVAVKEAEEIHERWMKRHGASQVLI